MGKHNDFTMHQNFQMTFLSNGNQLENRGCYSYSFRYLLNEKWRFSGQIGSLINNPFQPQQDFASVPYFWNGTLTYNNGHNFLFQISFGQPPQYRRNQNNFLKFTEME